MDNSKKSSLLSMITLIVSVAAALGVIAVGIMMFMHIGNINLLNVVSAALMLVISLANLIKAVLADKQKSLMLIWGAATLIFIAGFIIALITL